MLVAKNDIKQYIPQREPFLMIDNLIAADEKHAITSFQPDENNLFSKEGYFIEPGLIENIAQTAAAHAGYQYLRKGEPVPVGFIAAIRKLKVHELPKLQATLTTSVQIVNQVMNVTIVQGRVEVDKRVACECEMRIFIKEN